MKKIGYYVEMLRLRTLPLSVAGVIMGNTLASASGFFNGNIFTLTMLTATFLQILSNISNEIGDAKKGTDNEHRIGPIRGLQTGVLCMKDYYRMLFLFITLSAGTGIWLLIETFHSIGIQSLTMLLLGGVCIIAAMKYTMGKHAFGYIGLGDVFVFVFYGWVGVIGSYFLNASEIPARLFLPATAIGLLSAGVLNINNIRDIENDRACGKNTIAVRLGEHRAKIYHLLLIVSAFICLIIHSLISNNTFLHHYLYLITLPAFFLHIRFVMKHSGRPLNSQLKVLSILTLAISLVYNYN